MAAPDVNSSFSKSAKAGLLALAMATMPFAAANDAQAQQPQKVSAVYSTVDAIKAAGEYTRNEHGVGIVIFYGHDEGNKTSPDELGQRFVKELEKRGTKAQYFVSASKNPGAALAFHIRDIAQGPWDVRYAASQVSEIARLSKAANNLLAGTVGYNLNSH